MLRQAIRFGAAGLLNTGVSLAVIYAAMLMPHANPAVANALGYAVGLALGFALNRAWTFGCRERAALLLPAYLLAVAVCYAFNLAVIMVAISSLHMNPFLAQLIGVAVYTPSLFAISRRWVFRSRDPRAVNRGAGGQARSR